MELRHILYISGSVVDDGVRGAEGGGEGWLSFNIIAIDHPTIKGITHAGEMPPMSPRSD